MDDGLERLYSRWRAADEMNRDDEADAAFKALSEAVVPLRAVSLQFTETTTAAIAGAMAADARRATRARKALVRGGVAAGLVAAYFGAAPALSLVSTALVGLLGWTIQAVVWVSTGHDFSAWSVLNSLGRASAAFIVDPKVTVIMLTIQGIAIAGLVALRRLLGSDRELVE
jgi:hypothetical protein